MEDRQNHKIDDKMLREDYTIFSVCFSILVKLTQYIILFAKRLNKLNRVIKKKRDESIKQKTRIEKQVKTMPTITSSTNRVRSFI